MILGVSDARWSSMRTLRLGSLKHMKERDNRIKIKNLFFNMTWLLHAQFTYGVLNLRLDNNLLSRLSTPGPSVYGRVRLCHRVSMILTVSHSDGNAKVEAQSSGAEPCSKEPTADAPTGRVFTVFESKISRMRSFLY